LLLKFPRALPITLFLLIAAMTFLSVYSIESYAQERNREEVRDYASSIASGLDRRGNSFSSYLRAGAAMISAIEEFDPQTFSQFVAELRLDQNYSGAEGIGWATVIESDEADAFLQSTRVRQPFYPAIRPALTSAKGRVAPVTYFSPDTSRNRQSLGFDMYSDTARAEAMDEARRTVMPTASGKIALAQADEGGALGFVIFMPVFRPVADSPTQARELTGFIFSAFDAGKFLDAAIDRAPPTELGVRLYDGAAQNSNLIVSRSLVSDGNETFEQPVRIANRDFTLVIESAGTGPLGTLSMVTLVAGLALASLLMLVLRLLAVQAIEDQTRLAFYEEQHSIRNSLSRELNHRVKNALANVLSILSLTKRRATDLDSFAASLDGRIRALSATHDLLSESKWGTVSMTSVIETETQHFVQAKNASLLIEGPPVQLAPNDALSFGMAIHELATNAAKFGALSEHSGTVAVRWHLESDKLAKVEWIEQGGPVVAETRKRGFGIELIEKIIAHELKNRVELQFLPEGVRCVMRVPVRSRGEFQIREVRAPAS